MSSITGGSVGGGGGGWGQGVTPLEGDSVSDSVSVILHHRSKKAKDL